MRKPLQIKLEDLRQDQLKELLQLVEQVFIQYDVDFYLLGAIARDTWYVKEQIASRATRDVDFAVYISERVNIRRFWKSSLAIMDFLK